MRLPHQEGAATFGKMSRVCCRIHDRAGAADARQPFLRRFVFLDGRLLGDPGVWVVLIASLIIATLAFKASDEQRTVDHLVRYIVRGWSA